MRRNLPAELSLIRKLKLNQLMIFERVLETRFVVPQQHLAAQKTAQAVAHNTASNASRDSAKADPSEHK